MSKHFKTKRKIKYSIIVKYLLLLLIFYIVIKIFIVLFLEVPIMQYTFSRNKVYKIKQHILDLTINNPLNLLDIKENENYIEEIPMSYMVNNKKQVYIYNTHQKEAYSNNKTVYDASLVFKEELDKYNLDVIVENNDITEFMQANNISYSYSYTASKYFVMDILSKNNIDLLIDLHRDATEKSVVTLETKKRNYAKILFVVGGEHKNYKKNLQLANNINNKIIKKYPKLSRGVIVKTGNNVDGIYNQNLSSNMILLEIGSNTSTFEEVTNTIKVIAPIIGEYLYEK